MTSVKGIASMAAKKDDKGEVKTKPSSSSSDKAVKAAVEALADGDAKGAARALKLAIRACMTEYEAEEDGADSDD